MEEEEEEAKKEIALPVERLPMEEEEEEGEEPVGAEPEQIQENQQQEQRKVECSIEKENDSLEDGEIFEEGAVIKSLSEVKEAIQAAKKKNKKRGKKKNKRKRQQQEVLLQNGIVEEGPPMMPLHGTPPIHMSHLLGSQPGPGHMHLLPTPGTDGRYLMGGPPMQMMARRGPPIYGYPGEYDKDHQILRVNRNGNMAMLGNKTQDVEMVYQEAEKSLEERRGRKRYQPSKQNQVVEKNEMDVDVDVDVDVDLDLDSLRAAALRSKVIVSMSKIEEKKMDLNEKNQINKEEKENQEKEKENQEKDTSIDLLRLEILKSMHQKNETVMKISSHKEEQKNEEEQKTMSVACSTASITSASSISNGVPTNTAAEVNQSTNGGIHTTNNNNTQKKPMATALFSSSSPASSLRPLTVFSQSIIIHLSPEDLSSPSSSSSLSSSSSAATATAATAATAAVAFTNNTTNSLGNVHSFSSDSNSSSHSNKYISEQKNSLQAAIEEMKRKIKEKEAKIKKNPIEKPCFTTATTTTISAATTSTNNTDSSSANTITFGQVVEKKKESSCSFVMPTPTPTPTPTSPICKAFVAKELIEVKKKYLSALQDFETTQNELQNLDQAIAQVKQAIQFKSSLALNVSSSTTMAATIKATIKATEGK
jgi:hypothetical protein